MNGVERGRLQALDRCLALLEETLAGGRARVDAPLGFKIRQLLGSCGLVPDHRLEGRRVDRVLDDIFQLQSSVLGTDDEQAAG